MIARRCSSQAAPYWWFAVGQLPQLVQCWLSLCLKLNRALGFMLFDAISMMYKSTRRSSSVQMMTVIKPPCGALSL